MKLFPAEPRSSPSIPDEVAFSDQPGTLWSWIWMGLACIILAISGAAQAWEDYRFRSVQTQDVSPPFILKDKIPQTLGLQGEWKAKKGEESVLDPNISRVAGARDSLVRTYVDRQTGVSLVVAVLYGPAGQITSHTPEVCYTSQGYEQLDMLDMGPFPVDQSQSPVKARYLIFSKKGGREKPRDEVLYAFRHEGRWSPEVGGRWKTLESGPPVFKVMVQRRLADHEQSMGIYDPSFRFLAQVLGAIELQIRNSEQAPRRSIPMPNP